MTTLDDIRAWEFERVQHALKGSPQVLELGGGNGRQASLMAAAGAHVESIDVAAPPSGAIVHYPVRLYGGGAIPFPDERFDIVFSSNVLEHIADLDLTLAETLRVLRPGGMALHILPTPAWRWWTSLAHYPHLLRRALQRRQGHARHAENEAPLLAAGPRRGLLARVLLAGPHGEYPSAAAELWYFSRRRWLKVFAQSGFEPVHNHPTGLFYTGYALLPALSLPLRQALTHALGSSTRVFILRKPT